MSEKKNLKILIVDDEKVVRDFLLRLLSMEASFVKAVENGHQALQEAEKEKFDFFFLDIRMPEMDGVELLGQLKKVSAESRFVMMTGYAVDDQLEKAKQLGIFASIKKPFDIAQVVSLLKEAPRQAKEESKNSVRILAIDDDKTVLDFFKNLLKEKDCELVTMEKGKDALEALSGKDYDLIFLDLVLKDMSGIELYLKIKEAKPHAEVVLMTGYSEKVENLEPLGISCCLTKPFEIDKILSEINRIRKNKEG